MQDMLPRLEEAYRIWHESRGARRDVWADLLDDLVSFRTVGQPKRGFSFAQARQSREEVVNYLTRLTGDWEMIHFLPKSLVRQDNRIAMFGTAKWTHRSTGKSCEVLVGHMWRFREDKAVEVIEIFDSARVLAAMIPDP